MRCVLIAGLFAALALAAAAAADDGFMEQRALEQRAEAIVAQHAVVKCARSETSWREWMASRG